MKQLLNKIRWFLVCSLLILQLAGCVSTEQFYEDVSLSRESAYRQWKDRKKLEKQSQIKIAGKLSIEDCLKLTVVNNKTLQRIVQEKEIARGNELSSYSAILPSVGLTGDYLRKDEVASLGPIIFGDVDNYSVNLKVTQPVFAGGSIAAKINAGKLFSLLADQTVRAAVQDVIYQASRGYYDVLLNQHLYQISADAVRSARAHLEDVKRKKAGGVASGFDVLRAEVELSNFQAELIKNKNAINVSKSELIKTMGVSQDSEFVLSGQLTYLEWQVVMEEAVETAFRNRPDLFSSEFEFDAQGFQHVGAATLTAHGAVAVLGYLEPGASDNKGSRRRDIEGA